MAPADLTEPASQPIHCDEIEPEQLGWKGWVVMSTLVCGFVLLLRDTAGPDFVMVGMLAVIMALRIIPVKCALEGFMNEGLLTVAGNGKLIGRRIIGGHIHLILQFH